MSALTIFYQECPVCGRKLRVPAKYFGRMMTCSHCQGEFRAGKEEIPEPPPAAETELKAGLLSPGVFTPSQLDEV